MTAYGVFHALKEGRIKLDDMVTISAHARDQDGSRMFVEVGTLVSVENLIQGMIVQSGNDATVALAEHVAGSEPVFVDLMNQYAQQLGMTSSHFENSPGMPGPQHYTTARDIGCLPPRWSASIPSTTSGTRSANSPGTRSPSRIAMVCSIATRSIDGLKTGHTESAGYCLVSSASATACA